MWPPIRDSPSIDATSQALQPMGLSVASLPLAPSAETSTSSGRMSTVIDLNFVFVSEADDALVVGFADHEFETSRYVMFQRSLDPDEDDGVYAERDGQQYCAYGRVESCTLSRDQVNFVLSQPLADAL